MLPPSTVVTATTERFQRRAPERQETLRRIETKPPAQVDSSERVQQRVERLVRASRAPESVHPELPAAAVQDAARVGLERVLGQNDLIGVAYLELGARVARSVGRVLIRSSRLRLEGFGTGFLVSPRLLLTNNHVLDTEAVAATSQIEFNFQDSFDGQQAGTVLFDLDPAAFFVTNAALDFTLVAIKDTESRAEELATFGFNRLIENQGKVLLGEALNIIQHPNGEPKQLALRQNMLVDLLPDFLHYQTDTAPGSSGSPVFNDQWEVVGLHHSGVPRRDSSGRILALGGAVWTSAMGEHRIDWLANEGVRVSRIIAHVKDLSALSDAQRTIRNGLFEAVPATARDTARHVHPAQRTSSGNGSVTDVRVPHANADGSVSWMIPVTISVQLGTPSAPSSRPVIDTPGPGLPTRAPQSPDRPTASIDSPAAVQPITDSDERRLALSTAREARRRTYLDEAAERREIDTYYRHIDVAEGGESLFRALHALLEETHKTRPAYKPAVHVYPWVDLQENKKLRSVYSTQEFEPEELIEEDFRIEARREEMLRERLASGGGTAEALRETVDLLEANLPFNCEHVVPQSWFDKREPMRGDLHHLFACETTCNSFRGNIPYFDFPDFDEVVRTACGKRETGRFEPGHGKGIVARATLYFLLRYPGLLTEAPREFDEDRLRVLLAWHATHPVTRYERHRNQAIFAAQGNRNPLIDHPEWARYISFRL